MCIVQLLLDNNHDADPPVHPGIDAAADLPAPASAADDPVTPPAVQAEAWGIVTSQAVTVAGHEFSSHFIAAWRDKPGSERYSLSIRERATARWGSQVWIEFGQQRIVQLQLPPARAGLQALAGATDEF